MISYGFSLQGKGHIKNGVVCQDFNKHGKLQSGQYIGIVADGVGSAKHSDEGSKIATESLFEYCNKKIKIGDNSDSIQEILEEGYSYALAQVEKYALNKEVRIDEFDTTLSSVIYDGNNLIYGHAGDGGIIARYTDGTTKSITKRQKGADGISVRPLRAGGHSWDFGIDTNVASVLLATDGMLDGVIQPNLVNLPPDIMSMSRGNYKKDNVYITASEFFMNPEAVYKNKQVKDSDEFMKHFLEGDLSEEDQENFLQCMITCYTKMFSKNEAVKIASRIKKYFYILLLVKNVADDKSVVCIMNEKVKVSPKELKYYEEPNWPLLSERYDALLNGKEMPVDPPEEKGEDHPEELEITDDGGGGDKPPERIKEINWNKKLILISSSIGVFLILGAFVGGLLLGISYSKKSSVDDKNKSTIALNHDKSGTKNDKATKTSEPTAEPSPNTLPYMPKVLCKYGTVETCVVEECKYHYIKQPKEKLNEIIEKRNVNSDVRLEIKNYSKAKPEAPILDFYLGIGDNSKLKDIDVEKIIFSTLGEITCLDKSKTYIYSNNLFLVKEGEGSNENKQEEITKLHLLTIAEDKKLRYLGYFYIHKFTDDFDKVLHNIFDNVDSVKRVYYDKINEFAITPKPKKTNCYRYQIEDKEVHLSN